MNRLTLASLICLVFCLSAHGADGTQNAPAKKPKDTHPVYTDPTKVADPDFTIQGEYVGDIAGGKGKLGVQVIALGDGNFTAVFHTGGLPGEGWDGKPRVNVDGTRAGDKVVFNSKDYFASIANGVLTGKTENLGTFELKRVDRVSPDEGEKPAEGATVLFDGTNADAFQDGKIDERHLLEQGTKTKKKYQDFKMHVEFMLPYKPFGRDQDRGNSGIYIQERYEIQVLDTFGHPEEFNGCGSTYRQTPPKVNMCYPPLRWQTYDIDFTAPKWDASGTKTANAHVTIRHNGVIVQDNTELKTKTGAGQKEGPEPGFILLQAHNNPVFFRNIWIVEKK